MLSSPSPRKKHRRSQTTTSAAGVGDSYTPRPKRMRSSQPPEPAPAPRTRASRRQSLGDRAKPIEIFFENKWYLAREVAQVPAGVRFEFVNEKFSTVIPEDELSERVRRSTATPSLPPRDSTLCLIV
jgi:hypothetical protein